MFCIYIASPAAIAMPAAAGTGTGDSHSVGRASLPGSPDRACRPVVVAPVASAAPAARAAAVAEAGAAEAEAVARSKSTPCALRGHPRASSGCPAITKESVREDQSSAGVSCV